MMVHHCFNRIVVRWPRLSIALFTMSSTARPLMRILTLEWNARMFLEAFCHQRPKNTLAHRGGRVLAFIAFPPHSKAEYSSDNFTLPPAPSTRVWCGCDVSYFTYHSDSKPNTDCASRQSPIARSYMPKCSWKPSSTSVPRTCTHVLGSLLRLASQEHAWPVGRNGVPQGMAAPHGYSLQPWEARRPTWEARRDPHTHTHTHTHTHPSVRSHFGSSHCGLKLVFGK